jgi:hypothetical protein
VADSRDTEPGEPFVFLLTEDKLRECRHMTAEEKLRWLEEANTFVRKFVPSERLERWARFRERNQVKTDERGSK